MMNSEISTKSLIYCCEQVLDKPCPSHKTGESLEKCVTPPLSKNEVHVNPVEYVPKFDYLLNQSTYSIVLYVVYHEVGTHELSLFYVR